MAGFDISDDEVAKTHARYMIGGCAVVPNERLFRFGRHPLAYPLNLLTRASCQNFLNDRVLCATSCRVSMLVQAGIYPFSTIAITVQVRTIPFSASVSGLWNRNRFGQSFNGDPSSPRRLPSIRRVFGPARLSLCGGNWERSVQKIPQRTGCSE
jgi:hypothetical protein